MEQKTAANQRRPKTCYTRRFAIPIALASQTHPATTGPDRFLKIYNPCYHIFIIPDEPRSDHIQDSHDASRYSSEAKAGGEPAWEISSSRSKGPSWKPAVVWKKYIAQKGVQRITVFGTVLPHWWQSYSQYSARSHRLNWHLSNPDESGHRS